MASYAVTQNIQMIRNARKAYKAEQAAREAFQSPVQVPTITPPPVVNPHLWDDEPAAPVQPKEMAYYIVRLYTYSGMDLQYEMKNVYAASEDEAKSVMQMNYRIPQSQLYCLYAFKQDGKM